MRSIRLQRGWTQADVADKVKVSRAMIAQIEGGQKRASLPCLIRLAKALDCKADKLAGRYVAWLASRPSKRGSRGKGPCGTVSRESRGKTGRHVLSRAGAS